MTKMQKAFAVSAKDRVLKIGDYYAFGNNGGKFDNMAQRNNRMLHRECSKLFKSGIYGK
jgi:hypothetical protein